MADVDPDLTPGIALDRLRDAAADVIDSLGNDRLAAIGDDQLLDFTRCFETIRNQLAVVDHEIVTACESTTLARRRAQCTTAKLLVDVLLIDDGEAHRRVRAAKALRGETSMLGEHLEPRRPELAAAVAAGQIPPGNTDRAVQALRDLQQLPWTTPDDISTAEHLVTEAAQQLTPGGLRVFIAELADRINPDGTYSEEQVHQAKRGVYLWEGRDGAWHLQGRLTPGAGQKLNAILEPLTAPQHSRASQPGRGVRPGQDDCAAHDDAAGQDDGSGQDDVGEPDLRNRGQRTHDALDEAFTRLLQSDDNPSVGGTPATVIIIIDHDKLIGRFGHGHYADGSPISAEAARRLADQADIIPTILAANGKVLWLGRDRRIADKNQTLALAARDVGCSFPGCDRPPSWCQRHHIISWVDGGKTDIDNLTLACLFHHAHFEELGWQCRMINGLPYWIPPKWIDREQRPRLNGRIRLRHRPGPLTEVELGA